MEKLPSHYQEQLKGCVGQIDIEISQQEEWTYPLMADTVR